MLRLGENPQEFFSRVGHGLEARPTTSASGRDRARRNGSGGGGVRRPFARETRKVFSIVGFACALSGSIGPRT